MDKVPPVKRIAELQNVIAEFAQVERVLRMPGTKRLENDVEHSYGLALTCWYLVPKIAPHLNMQKILQYALAHDIVELHSGDTYIFDEERVSTKLERETEALELLRKGWPDFPELTDSAEKYMGKHDPEARFVYTIDKMLPPILINLDEKSDFWHRYKVTRKMHEAEKRDKMQYSPEAKIYCELLIEWLAQPDYFYPGKPTASKKL